MISSLQYLTLARPEIQFVINKLSHYMSSPRHLHWVAMKIVLRYLSRSQMVGIMLRLVYSFTVIGFFNADWTGDTQDRRSQMGYLIYVRNIMIAWSWKKQEVVARSSTESEYWAITTTTMNKKCDD